MSHGIVRIIRKLQIKIHHIRSKFDIVILDKYPHIKVNEKHEKKVKWVLRVLALIGITSSVIAFSEWYYSLIFSLVLFVVEQIFEQIIFTHAIMLVQPLPNNWDASKWTGMIVATDEKNIFLGFGFSDRTVGMDFFNTLFAWNEDSEINTGKIQLSLIQEDENNYSVNIYPTAERTFVKENFDKQALAFDKKINAGKELNILLVQICFCKVFPISQKCAYNLLKGNYSNIYIQLYDTSEVVENRPDTYMNVHQVDNRTILFKQINVCKRSELNKADFPLEYYNVPKY